MLMSSNVSLKQCENLRLPVWDELKKKTLEVFGVPFSGHDGATSVTVETHTSKFSPRNPFWTLPSINYV